MTGRPALPDGLRAATDADSADLIVLIGAAFAEYPGCVLDLPGIDAWMRAPGTAYEGTGGQLWVLPGAAGLRACVGYRPIAPDRMELKSLYVAGSARRRGLGRRLVALVETAARDLGARTVQLWSDSRFLDAHRLYESLGYRRGSRTRRLHDPSDTTEYFFERDLAGTSPTGTCPAISGPSGDA